MLSWWAAVQAKVWISLIGVIGGFAVRMLHKPPVTYADIGRHLAIAVIFGVLLADPIAKGVVHFSGLNVKDNLGVLVTAGMVIGYLGRDLIDGLVSIGRKRVGL